MVGLHFFFFLGGGGGGGVRFNSPLRHYFSLFWVISQREVERKKEMVEERKKYPNSPHLLKAQ